MLAIEWPAPPDPPGPEPPVPTLTPGEILRWAALVPTAVRSGLATPLGERLAGRRGAAAVRSTQ